MPAGYAVQLPPTATHYVMHCQVVIYLFKLHSGRFFVRGVKQAEIAKEYNITKGSVSQASKRVWLGFLRSKGYKEVSVVLSEVKAFIVEGWGKETMDEINNKVK